MGYASYLEDIINRFNGEISFVQENIEKLNIDNQTRKQLVKQSESLLALCKNTLNEVNTVLDLVTDPEVDISREYERLKKEVRHKNIIIYNMKSKIESLSIEHKDNIEKLIRNYESKIIALKNNHRKDIANAKREATDYAQKMFIEYGDEFREELGY